MSTISGDTTVLFGPEPNPGDRLGNYILDRKLGSGGMGHVWKAIHEPTGKPYAIKLLPPIIASNPDAWDQVRRNFDIIENLNHPHICAVKVLDRDAKYGPYLVMAHVEGMTLKKYRQGRTFTPEQVAAILKPVAEALDFAHSRKVIHRDIKHENIMVVLADDGQTITDTYVIDFGLAAESRTVVTQFSQQSAPLAGTLRYMAPELWRGRPPVPASDQYALVVIAYELLAGYFPIDGVDRGIMREAVLTEPVEPISGQPASVNEALLKGLAKKPEERFASCILLTQMNAIHAPRLPSVSQESTPTFPASPLPLKVEVRGKGRFSTIKDAIAVAAKGDNLILDPGEYQEDSLVVACSLKLFSSNEDRKPVLSSSQSLIFSTAPGVTLELHGLAIHCTSEDSTAIQSSSASLVLRNCDIIGTIAGEEGSLDVRGSQFRIGRMTKDNADRSWTGVAWRSGKVELDRCSFDGVQYPVDITDANVVIHDSDFTKCKLAVNALRCSFQMEYGRITNCDSAMELRHCRDFCHIMESQISKCKRDGVSTAHGDTYLKDVTISDVEGDGASVYDGTVDLVNCKVTGCVVGVSGGGREHSDLKCTETKIDRCVTGVSGSKVTTVDIHECEIINCKENGIFYSGRLEVFRSTIRRNGGHGIVGLRSASPAYVTGTDLSGNREGEYRLPEGSDVHD